MASEAAKQRARAAQRAAADRAESRLRTALYAAMAAYLAAAARAVLEDAPGASSAAPDLSGWPSDRAWHDQVAATVVPVVMAAWRAAYRRTWPGHDPKPGDEAAYAAALLARVGDPGFPRYALGQARAEIAAGQAAGENGASLRQRLRQLLHIDAPGKAARAALLAIWLRRRAGAGRAKDDAREAKIKARGARRGLWRSAANGTATHEATAAVGDGAYTGAGDFEFATGEILLKEWDAIEDHRTRPAHGRADGQTVGVDEWFYVGGEAMRYPGDPGATAANTANCRCSLLIFAGTVGEDEDGEGDQMGDSLYDDTGLDDAELDDVLAAAGAGGGAPEVFARRRAGAKKAKAKKPKKAKAAAKKTGHKAGAKGTGSVKKAAAKKTPAGKVKNQATAPGTKRRAAGNPAGTGGQKGGGAAPKKAPSGLGRHVPHRSHPVGKGAHWSAPAPEGGGYEGRIRWSALSP